MRGELFTLVIMLAVIPGLVSLFIGVLAFRRVTPLVFVCLRCDRVFRRAPHRRHTAACPHCGATDWNRSRHDGDDDAADGDAAA